VTRAIDKDQGTMSTVRTG